MEVAARPIKAAAAAAIKQAVTETEATKTEVTKTNGLVTMRTTGTKPVTGANEAAETEPTTEEKRQGNEGAGRIGALQVRNRPGPQGEKTQLENGPQHDTMQVYKVTSKNSRACILLDLFSSHFTKMLVHTKSFDSAFCFV